MNKAELVDAIAKATGETKRKTEGFLDAFVETVVGAVAKGNKVSIVGFGNFERKHRDARKGRNPRTGQTINIAAKNYPSFTPGKGFKDKVA
ncbi:MAG TPA: HU family DNA-binding protein [Bacteroidetes bacterium]|nr:HU family DNA-binding protein [Bacteroidota bacterium]